MFKVNHTTTTTWCEIRTTFMIKTTKQRPFQYFIVNFELINADWVDSKADGSDDEED